MEQTRNYDDWYDSLDDQHKQYANILNAYFQYKTGDENFGGKHRTSDFKSTQEIADDLYDMIILDREDILEYMFYRDFELVTLPDGTVKWKIYRIQEGNI